MTLDDEDRALAELARVRHPAGSLRLPPPEPGDTVQVLTGRIPQGRWDHELIASLVPAGSSVLDLGCGRGSLLHGLREAKGVSVQGVEKDPGRVAECVKKGVPVIQGDLDGGLLARFGDDAFDYVVLEMTLQTVKNPVEVMRQMLRVGRVGVVSFPNFGHWTVREQLLREGRTPVTDALPFRWFDTPNIRVLTLRDFEEFCARHEVHILDRYVMAGGRYRPMQSRDNVTAEEALYVVCRADQLDRHTDGAGI